MPDDKSKTGWQDDIRVNIHQPYELRDWSKKLGVTPERLKELVSKHGTYVSKIKQALGK